MNDMNLRRMRERLVVALAALSLGCAGAVASSSLSRPALLHHLTLSARQDPRRSALGDCDNLRPPAKSTLVAHYYATGVQIYRWSDTAWTFVAPDAVLSADAAGKTRVGTHYAGPTWESVSGSKVVGAVAQRCIPDATAIPWLSLTAVPSDRTGIFRGVTFIQRVHTTGGLAPSTPGTTTGEQARVPYTAEYFFYRASVSRARMSPATSDRSSFS